ncbi:unnamed protein product, partial [Rotaria sp. Silwood1]
MTIGDIKITDQSTSLVVTPAWYEPVKSPDADKVRLPVHYNKDSPTDVLTFQCLSTYRSMKNKDQMIDFIAEPFVATTDNTETLIVVLNELAEELGARLSFTEKAFQYDNSDYRTACGIELQESDLDSRYNRDYPDAQEEMRGGRPYYFPQGWYRHALKVDDKYSNDHVWLGMSNSPGEWSVAYHGTAAGAVKSIVKGGLKHDFVTTDACKDAAKLQRPSIPDVKGLYVATHCEGGAAEYASNFEIKDSSGTIREYQVVFQCRVENDQFTEHQGPVSIGLALRVFNEKAIRPYGILLKECSS